MTPVAPVTALILSITFWSVSEPLRSTTCGVSTPSPIRIDPGRTPSPWLTTARRGAPITPGSRSTDPRISLDSALKARAPLRLVATESPSATSDVCSSSSPWKTTAPSGWAKGARSVRLPPKMNRPSTRVFPRLTASFRSWSISSAAARLVSGVEESFACWRAITRARSSRSLACWRAKSVRSTRAAAVSIVL